MATAMLEKEMEEETQMETEESASSTREMAIMATPMLTLTLATATATQETTMPTPTPEMQAMEMNGVRSQLAVQETMPTPMLAIMGGIGEGTTMLVGTITTMVMLEVVG